MLVFFEHDDERFLRFIEIVFKKINLRTLNLGWQELLVCCHHLITNIQCFLPIICELVLIQKSHLVQHGPVIYLLCSEEILSSLFVQLLPVILGREQVALAQQCL